jgi:hypothetical protein
MGENGVRYRDEVWTGIEYQVATNMIYEGMITEGLSIVKGIHERYSPEKHNPWNEIECGDHYARALASWGVLLALENFVYNGPAKTLAYAPAVQKEHFSGFFAAAEGWGNLRQERSAGQQVNTVSLAYGKLRLRQLSFELPGRAKEVQLALDGKRIACRFVQSENHVTLSFDETEVNALQQLSVSAEF